MCKPYFPLPLLNPLINFNVLPALEQEGDIVATLHSPIITLLKILIANNLHIYNSTSDEDF
jgi:hypothetical protein